MKYCVVVVAICFWIVWNYWANFFFWVTSWYILSDTKTLSDFFNLYQEGKMWLSHSTHLSTYPPTSLPFFGVFALFDFGFASQLWIATCLSLFIVALLALTFTLKWERRHLFVSIAVLLFLTSYPLRFELQLGQINLLIMSLTILSLVSQRLKHDFPSTVLLSIGTLLKGVPVLFLIYFVIFRRDLRYLAHFLIATLVIIGASLLVVPIQLYWYWVGNVVPKVLVAASTLNNESITRYFSLAGLAGLTPIIFFASVCSLAVFAFYVNSDKFMALGKAPLRADAMFLINALVMLLFGSRSWPQDYVWVILPIALLLSGLIMEDVKAAYLMILGFATFLLNSTPYPLFMYYLNSYHLGLGALPTGAIGSVILTVSLIPMYLRPSWIFYSIKKQMAHTKQSTS